MSQGSAPRQADLFRDTSSFVEPLVRPDSIHALLARECHALFPDALRLATAAGAATAASCGSSVASRAATEALLSQVCIEELGEVSIT